MQLTYEPIEKSCWERHKPEFVDDFMTLSSKSKICFIFLSLLVIGGGTAGCIIAANGGTSSYEHEPIGKLTYLQLQGISH